MSRAGGGNAEVMAPEEHCRRMSQTMHALAPAVAPCVLPAGVPTDFLSLCTSASQRFSVQTLIEEAAEKATRCEVAGCTRRGVGEGSKAASVAEGGEDILRLTTLWKTDYVTKTVAINDIQWECSTCRLLRNTNESLQMMIGGKSKRMASLFKETNMSEDGDESGKLSLSYVMDTMQRSFSIAYALTVLLQSMEVVAIDHSGEEINDKTDFVKLLMQYAKGDLKKALVANKKPKKKASSKTPKKKRKLE